MVANGGNGTNSHASRRAGPTAWQEAAGTGAAAMIAAELRDADPPAGCTGNTVGVVFPDPRTCAR